MSCHQTEEKIRQKNCISYSQTLVWKECPQRAEQMSYSSSFEWNRIAPIEHRSCRGNRDEHWSSYLARLRTQKHRVTKEPLACRRRWIIKCKGILCERFTRLVNSIHRRKCIASSVVCLPFSQKDKFTHSIEVQFTCWRHSRRSCSGDRHRSVFSLSLFLFPNEIYTISNGGWLDNICSSGREKSNVRWLRE
jgi:hypothetical protein